MKIDEIKNEAAVPELVARVISVGPPRMIVTKSGRRTQLKEVLLGDESGTIVLSLWGFGAGEDLVSGKVIKIINGWGKDWRGKTQLTLGRNGKYEVISDDESIPPLKDLITKHGSGDMSA